MSSLIDFAAVKHEYGAEGETGGYDDTLYTTGFNKNLFKHFFGDADILDKTRGFFFLAKNEAKTICISKTLPAGRDRFGRAVAHKQFCTVPAGRWPSVEVNNLLSPGSPLDPAISSPLKVDSISIEGVKEIKSELRESLRIWIFTPDFGPDIYSIQNQFIDAALRLAPGVTLAIHVSSIPLATMTRPFRSLDKAGFLEITPNSLEQFLEKKLKSGGENSEMAVGGEPNLSQESQENRRQTVAPYGAELSSSHLDSSTSERAEEDNACGGSGLATGEEVRLLGRSREETNLQETGALVEDVENVVTLASQGEEDGLIGEVEDVASARLAPTVKEGEGGVENHPAAAESQLPEPRDKQAKPLPEPEEACEIEGAPSLSADLTSSEWAKEGGTSNGNDPAKSEEGRLLGDIRKEADLLAGGVLVEGVHEGAKVAFHSEEYAVVGVGDKAPKVQGVTLSDEFGCIDAAKAVFPGTEVGTGVKNGTARRENSSLRCVDFEAYANAVERLLDRAQRSFRLGKSTLQTLGLSVSAKTPSQHHRDVSWANQNICDSLRNGDIDGYSSNSSLEELFSSWLNFHLHRVVEYTKARDVVEFRNFLSGYDRIAELMRFAEWATQVQPRELQQAFSDEFSAFCGTCFQLFARKRMAVACSLLKNPNQAEPEPIK